MVLAASFSGLANATLQPRLGGAAVYDTDLNITWLANADLAATNTFGTTGINPNGTMSWNTAQNWIMSMNLAKYLGSSNWRLPATPQQDPTCMTQGATSYSCTGSELGHLFYADLGGQVLMAISQAHNSNYALFTNLQDYTDYGLYWSGTTYAADSTAAWEFGFGQGGQTWDSKSLAHFVIAVVTGDIAASAQTADLPHFATGGSFVTDFYVINTGSQSAHFSVSFYDDTGKPVSLPFSGLGSLATLSDTIDARGTKYYQAGVLTDALLAGSGLVTSDPGIVIQALFRRRGSDNSYYEAAVPSSSGNTEFEIPFDATTFAATGVPIFTGVAIANLDPVDSATVVCTARDSSGTVIPDALSVPVLNPLGHWANYQFPALTGHIGTLDCTSTSKVGAIGLRFLGYNGFSSLPVISIR